MKVYYDLHIHSCLSPCGDEDMTPNNIVNMARLAGLDMIALTDHNSCKNCPAILKVAERAGIVALAGMELCTAEECHVVCLFPDIGAAMEFDAMVEKTLPPIRNRPDAFGEQVIMDDGDKAAGSYETLLITASSISIDDVARIVGEYRGIALPPISTARHTALFPRWVRCLKRDFARSRFQGRGIPTDWPVYIPRCGGILFCVIPTPMSFAGFSRPNRGLSWIAPDPRP